MNTVEAFSVARITSLENFVFSGTYTTVSMVRERCALLSARDA